MSDHISTVVRTIENCETFNVASKPTNVMYLSQLTDEATKKYNTDDIPRLCDCSVHVSIYSSVGSYVTRLTKEYIIFYITLVLTASPDGEPSKQDIQQK
jgi:hypothetical protein